MPADDNDQTQNGEQNRRQKWKGIIGEKLGEKLGGSLFVNKAYTRLLSAQTVTSLGDWLGLIAITVLAGQIGAGSSETSIGFVLSARLIPGFFLSQLAGVVADKMDRRKLMMVCDMARALLLLSLPFADRIWHIVLISFLIEIFTLLWIPAKEALVPNLVPKESMSTVNSLSLIATYGTFPLASVFIFILVPLGKILGGVDALTFLQITDNSIAFYVDSLTFSASALLLYSMAKHINLASPAKIKSRLTGNIIWHYIVSAVKDSRDGLKYIAVTPVVRGVNLGLATALLGGGMLIPLGAIFADDVLNAGTMGFVSMQIALGSGVAVGVVILYFFNRHTKKITDEHVFVWSSWGAGVSLIVAVSSSSLLATLIFIGFLGIFAGTLYVAGFTLMHSRVSDDIRGRAFSSLYALMRFCVLISLAIGPFLATLIGRITIAIVGQDIGSYDLPRVRVTLWLAGLVILLAGGIASSGFKFKNGENGDIDENGENGENEKEKE